ncbi:MAG: hypothetical protein IPK82_06775 [Polyangiaceae bacterium]|nr:hypothetical protein [Polyangiaceae bacterium]
MIFPRFRRRSIAALAIALSAAVQLFPTSAQADVMCGGFDDCGQPIPAFVVLIQPADAAALGIVSIIGSGYTVAKSKPAGTGWLAVGYLGAAYNLTVGAVWTTTAIDMLNSGSNAGWGTLQVILGGSNLAIGATALGLTLKAHSQGTSTESDMARLPPILPSFAPIPGGGMVTVNGQF